MALSGNAIFKPIPSLKPFTIINPEMVDGMAQQETDVSGSPLQSTAQQPATPKRTVQYKEGVVDNLSIWAKTQVDDVKAIFQGLVPAARHVVNELANMEAPLWVSPALNWRKLYNLGARDKIQRTKPNPLAEIYDAIQEEPGLVLESSKTVLKDVWHVMTDHYRDDAGALTVASALKGGRDHTFLAALDIASIASLGAGGTTRLATKLTKMAAAAAAAGDSAKAAKYMEVAAKVSGYAEKMQKVSDLPLIAGKKMVGLAEQIPWVRKVEDVFGIDPISREAYWQKGAMKAQALGVAAKEFYGLALNKIPDESRKAKLADIMDLASPAMKSEWADIPEVWNSIDAWGKLRKQQMEYLERMQVKFATGPVTAGAEAGAQIKKVALRLRDMKLGTPEKITELGGRKNFELWLEKTPEGNAFKQRLEADISPIEKAEAEAHRASVIAINESQGLQHSSHFWRPWVEEMMFDPEAALEGLGAMAGPWSKRKLSTLERVGRSKLLDTDPNTWTIRALVADAEINTEIKWLNQISEKYGQLIKRGDFVPDGLEELPEVYAKYLDDQLMVNRLLARDVKNGVAEAIINSADEANRYAIDNFFAKKDTNYRVYIPRGLARAIRWEMQTTSGLGRLYDSAMGFWKYAIFTTPRFYVNNLLGNAVLSILYGVNPMRALRKVRPEDVTRMLLSYADSGIGPVYSTMDRLVARTLPERARDKARSLLRSWAQTQSSWSGKVDAMFREYIYDLEAKTKFEKDFVRIKEITSKIDPATLNSMKEMHGTIDKISEAIRDKGLSEAGESFVEGAKVLESKPLVDIGRLRSERDVAVRELGKFDAETGALKDDLLALSENISGIPGGKEAINADMATLLDRETQRVALLSKIDGLTGEIKKFDDWHEAFRKIKSADQVKKSLAPLAEIVDENIKTMESFLGDYGRLTPFGRKVIRRWIAPFWVFQKTMFTLAWKMPWLRPGKTLLWHHIAKMAMDSFEDERLPFQLKNAIFLGSTPDGRLIFSRMTNFDPLQSSSIREIGPVAVPSMLDPLQNPLLQVFHRWEGGYDTFSNPVPLGKDKFMDSWGRVWEWDPDRHAAKRVNPGDRPFFMGLWEAIGDTIPQVQWLNDILASNGFETVGRGPRIKYDASGKIKNPRESWWVVPRSMGFPVDSGKISELKQSERLDRYYKIKQVVAQIRRVEREEDRQKLRVILYDMLRHPDFKNIR